MSGVRGGRKPVKKPIPVEIRDLVEIVRRECRSFDDFLYKIRVIATRPYSRISAIVSKSENAITLADVCRLGPYKPRHTVEGMLYHDYVRKLDICGKPRIRIYRGYTDEIKPGDWVYLERSRAEDHAEIHGYRVYEKEVSPEDIIWAGTSPDEWYYVPKRLRGYFSSLEEFWYSATDP